MINKIRRYSMDIYLLFFIGILSRKESKIMIKFLSSIFHLFTILLTLFYRISSMIICKKNEIFDKRLNIHS